MKISELLVSILVGIVFGALAGFIAYGIFENANANHAYGEPMNATFMMTDNLLYNNTLILEKDDLGWCLNTGKAMYCNEAEIDNDRFRLISSFFEFLNSGIVELDDDR